VAAARGLLKANFTVTPLFAFREAGEAAVGPRVAEFTVRVPGAAGYTITYRYNAPTGKYLRYSKHRAERDDLDGLQLRAENVIIQLVPVRPIAGDSAGRLEVTLTGAGEALVFTDGRLLRARWEKPNRHARTRFVDSAGELVRLTPGRTHILLMPSDTEIVGLPES